MAKPCLWVAPPYPKCVTWSHSRTSHSVTSAGRNLRRGTVFRVNVRKLPKDRPFVWIHFPISFSSQYLRHCTRESRVDTWKRCPIKIHYHRAPEQSPRISLPAIARGTVGRGMPLFAVVWTQKILATIPCEFLVALAHPVLFVASAMIRAVHGTVRDIELGKETLPHIISITEEVDHHLEESVSFVNCNFYTSGLFNIFINKGSKINGSLIMKLNSLKNKDFL